MHALWVCGPSESVAAAVLATAVPGDPALRGRFHLLCDEPERGVDAAAFAITFEAFRAEVDGIDAGHDALTRHDAAAAEAAFEGVLGQADRGLHPLPIVDALIGLGELARHRSNDEEAVGYYEQALDLAGKVGYRYGRLQALLPLGHLTIRNGSAEEALERFRAAESLARDLDDRLALANALLGEAEAFERCRDWADASAALSDAASIFTALNSQVGVGGCLQRWGDLLRRQGDADGALSKFMEAAEASRDARDLIGVANCCDGIADIRLNRGEVDEAEAAFGEALRLARMCEYRQGEANAVSGLGRCSITRERWVQAAQHLEDALAIYRSIGDLMSETAVLGELAAIAEALENGPLAMHCRLEALAAIEARRAAQGRDGSQLEVRRRFRNVYSYALQTAHQIGDATGFVTAFESYAAPRLSALVDRVRDTRKQIASVRLTAQLAATADTKPFDGSDLDDSVDRAKRMVRLLGRVAVKAALPERAAVELDDLVAGSSRPYAHVESIPLLESVSAKTDVLLITLLPGSEKRVVWLFMRAGDDPYLGKVELSEPTTVLIARLAEHGLSPTDDAATLAASTELLPERLCEQLTDDPKPLLIVPLDRLWQIPWPAVPMPDGRYLGEVAAISVAPSLRLAMQRSNPRSHAPVTAGFWTGPDVRHHRVDAFAGSRLECRSLSSPEAAIAAATNASTDLVVLTAHGHPLQGVGNYLELGGDYRLTAMDYLDAEPPELLALIACWSGGGQAEPDTDRLTIATVAFAAGSQHVLATISPLSDDPIANRFVNSILARLTTKVPPVAIVEATRLILTNPDVRHGPVNRWAPIVCIGTS